MLKSQSIEVMSDEDFDGELPVISLNQDARDTDEFCMPSADVLASQRAREEKCEEELRQLRTQYGEEVIRIGHYDSNSSESEGSLTAAVDALNVVTLTSEASPDAPEIISNLITHLATYDIEFLTSYMEILQMNNDAIIQKATYDIVSTIENALMDARETGNKLNNNEVMVLGCWLCAATVWPSPRVPSARKLLHAILAMATTEQGEAIGVAVGACVASAAALVRAADAARPAPPARPLLAAALQRLAPAHTNENDPEQSSAERVWSRLCGAWRQLSPCDRHVALQVAGRALWRAVAAGARGAGPSGEGAAVRDLFAVAAQPPPGKHRHSPEHLKVLVGISKLQILFGINP